MPSTNSQRSTDETRQQAAIMVERLMRCYPPQDVGDPQIVTAGLIELVGNYSSRVIERVPSFTRGLPALFKFFPRPAEIKETMDAWQADEDRHEEKLERYGAPLPPNAGLLGYHRPKAKPYNLLVHKDHDGYEAMCRRAAREAADQSLPDERGIWVPINWWQERKTGLQKGVRTVGEAARDLQASPALRKVIAEKGRPAADPDDYGVSPAMVQDLPLVRAENARRHAELEAMNDEPAGVPFDDELPGEAAA